MWVINLMQRDPYCICDRSPHQTAEKVIMKRNRVLINTLVLSLEVRRPRKPKMVEVEKAKMVEEDKVEQTTKIKMKMKL